MGEDQEVAMPFKSKAQEAYFNVNRAKMEKQGVNVDEWNNASKGLNLPERVGKAAPVRKGWRKRSMR